MTPVVGVIGGMGPAATFDFCARLTAAWPAARDQDHPRILVDSDPAIPDRNAALRGDGPSPAPYLAAMAARLEGWGAGLIAMPCNTAHAFSDAITGALTIPFIDMAAATVDEAVAGSATAIGVLAVDGCLAAGLYQTALRERGVATILLSPADQLDFMAQIAAVKAGDTGPHVRERMLGLAQRLVDAGATRIIAGCTEIPLVLSAANLGVPLVVSTDALVRAVIEALHTAR